MILKRIQILNSYNHSGFTLIELSIVVVIIGLIVAGVVGGQALVRQDKIRSIISDVDKYKVAINTFRIAHDAYPGDLSTATDYGYTGNGNGDGDIVDINTETLYAWNHLGSYGVLPGSYTGAQDSSPRIVLGRTVPCAIAVRQTNGKKVTMINAI